MIKMNDNFPSTKYMELLESNTYYNSEYLEERMLTDMKDIYYNKDKFDSGEINLCFITGHSGSGKSTMGRGMASKDIEHYELDDVIANKTAYTMENLKEYGDLIYSFFKGLGKKYYYTENDMKDGVARGISDYSKEIIQDFVKYSISYSKSHKSTKFVIEGIWLLDYIEPAQLKNYAVYIKGTSFLKSTIRAANRDSKWDESQGKNRALSWIKRLAKSRSFFENEKGLKKYYSYFSKLSSVNENTDKLLEFKFNNFSISKILIFDIGSVLVEYRKPMEEAIKECKDIPDELASEIYSHIINTFSSNKIFYDCATSEEYYDSMIKSAPVKIKKYIPIALQADIDNSYVLPYTHNLLQLLKNAGYELYYLSNWSRWTRDALINNGVFDFLKYFNGGIFSCDVGMMKPDAEIYNKLLKDYGINPYDAVFFDDNQNNIDAANSIGIRGVLFNAEYTPRWIVEKFLSK